MVLAILLADSPLACIRWAKAAFCSSSALRRDVGVPGLVPHDLRHTCASLAIAAGANVLAVQKLLGHETATMTLDTYGHLFSDDLTKVAEALDKAARSVGA